MQRLHLAPTPLRLIPAGQKGNEAPQESQLLGWLHEAETEVSKLFPSGPNRAPGTGRAAGAMEEAACALFSPRREHRKVWGRLRMFSRRPLPQARCQKVP